MNRRLAKFAKETIFNTPLRRFVFPTYVYEFTPPQLCFMCAWLEKTRDVPGSVVEVGCHTGATTIFLNKHLDALRIDKPYITIDTFGGFVPNDVSFEVARRGKTTDMYRGRFEVNKKKWFDRTMEQNGIARVRSIESDVNALDLRAMGPLSFVLLDVDLYRPIAKALPELYEALSPGGIIVVDDCDSNNVRWDGADQAYKEFVESLGAPVEILHRKLGVIRKAESGVR